MIKVRAQKGKFVKQNGDIREMTFVQIPDLPEDFLQAKVKGTGKVRTMTDGRELVWEVENGFRVFNWNSVVGEVKEILVEKDVFLLDK